MKPNFQRERSYFKIERDKSNDKLNQRTLSNSQTKSIEKLSELNLDIEKLYKKYAKVKKERLMKEKSQRILVNRIKVLRSQQNSSKNKEKMANLKKNENYQKIQVKMNSKYNKRNILRRYRHSNKNKNSNESEAKSGNYKTINNNNLKDNRINSVSVNTNSNNKSDNNFENQRNYNESININSIDDFLKKYKYNFGNKNSNNNIYIIINNPNNYPEKKSGDSNSDKNYKNHTVMNKNDHNKINDFNNDENRKKHFKSDINLDFDNHNGEKIILMNTDGRKIEDIINSINNINIDKTGEKNNINNNNEKPSKKEKNNNNIIYYNNNEKEKENNDNKIINIKRINNGDENIISNKDIKDNNENIKKDKEKDEDNKSELNQLQNIKENNNIIKENNEKKKEDLNINNEFFKNIEDKNNQNNLNINNHEIKDNKLNEQFIRPNFLDLYKNEERNDTNKDKKEKNRNALKNSDITENNSQKLSLPIIRKNNNNSNKDLNEPISIDLHSINESSISNKKPIRKKVIIQNNKNTNINKSKKNISNYENSDIYSYKKKIDDIYNTNNTNNNSNKEVNNNTIPITNNENNKVIKVANTDDRNNSKKLLNNIIYTPKLVEKTNKIIINKKMDKSLTNNQRTKNYDTLKRNSNIKIKNNYHYNNLINYSLSYTNLSCKNKIISSNYSNNYNTKRNINLEKIKKNNLRKDSYCTTIEKKRKALGLQFKPDFEKELSIQYDKDNHNKKIFGKLKNYNLNKNTYDSSKNKVIKVNKREDGSINMEGINATPQRFRIFKKNGDNKNKHVFVKNKTTTNFNYIKKSMNSEIKNNLNDIKNKNIRKINNINSNYSLSENNNNSLVQINDSNLLFITNKTINNNN